MKEKIFIINTKLLIVETVFSALESHNFGKLFVCDSV